MRLTPAALAAAAKCDVDNFVTASTPGGIEAQEKAGQTTFVANATMPGPRHLLEKLGIKVGEPVDELFYSVTLPTGWKKVATDHSMWSELLDEKGRKRASIFYKAAFYDRKAHMRLDQRYGTSSYVNVNEKGEPAGDDCTHQAVIVTDCGKEIHRLGLYERGEYKQAEPLEAKAEGWLNEKFPQWREATAYWD